MRRRGRTTRVATAGPVHARSAATAARRLGASALPLGLALVLLGGCAARSAFNQGRDMAAAEDWDRAVYSYSKALSLEPQNIEYRKSLDLAKVKASQHHLELAKSYIAAGAVDLAIVEYRVAATLDPTNRYVADSLENAIEKKKELEDKADDRSDIERLKDETRGASTQPILRPDSDTPLTLNFPPNTKVKDIYVALGKASGINMLFDSGIRDQETFSIDISKISFKKALDQVALANRHFYKVIDEKTLMIVPDNPQKRRDYEDHVIKTFYLSNANPNDVVNTLRGLLDARRIATNPALNAITIRDTPAKLAVMERVIESNDKPPSEVVIDVEILEVKKSSSLAHGAGLSSYQVQEALEQTDTVGGLTGLRFSSLPYINASNWLLTFPSIIYKLEKNVGNVRTLARPSLRALDGKQVTLRLGDQVPIETSTFSAVAGTSQPLTRNFQFRDIGTNIDITPRVHHNNEVTLQLQVEVTSVGAGGDAAAGIPPTFGNRRINTEIRLKDGETNLLAGLFTSSDETARTGVPLLSDLPILRSILGTNSRKRSETDIVLTLTPHIVRTPNIRRQDLEPFYVGTETNVGGVGDVGLGSLGGASPFTPPAGGEEGESQPPHPPGAKPTPPRPGGRPTPGSISPGSSFPGSPTLPGTQSATPRPFNPEPGQPSPTSVLPSGALLEDEPRAASPSTGGSAAPVAAPVPGPSRAPSPTPAPAPAPAAPALVALVPPAATVATGEEVSVDVVVDNATSVSHAPFWIAFDPAVVQVTGVTEGAFLRSDGGATQFLSNVQPTGRVVVGLSRVGRAPGVSGAGVLASIRFRGVARGRSALTFSSASLRDAASAPLPATFVPGAITVP